MNETSNDTPRTMIGEIPVYCAYDEIIDIAKAVPNPQNPNTHSEKQLKLLAQIIKGTGWRNAITISRRSGYIVKGHGRLAAAAMLGAEQVPVEYQNYENEAAEHADMVADNRIAELAENDPEKLAEVLTELSKSGDMDLTGYTDQDLDEILGELAGQEDQPDNDHDTEQEQPLPPMSRLGDLWLLGQHRLICGDATDEATIDRLMNGEKAAMVHTDPPYGVSYTGNVRGQEWDMIKNDDLTGDDLMRKLLIPVFSNYRKHTIEKAAFYVWYAFTSQRDFEDALAAANITPYQQIIWAKPGGFDRVHYHWAHEPCFYCGKDGEIPNYYGDRKQQTVWKVTTKTDGQMMTVLGSGVTLTDGNGNKIFIADKPPKGKKTRYMRMDEGKSISLFQEDRMNTVWEVARETNTLHPTQKPVELPMRAIENSSQPGEIVLDFFGGSGSTLLGAELTGRRCFTTELDPCYADVIVSRYVTQSGNLGVTCIRDGKEYRYIDMVRAWAKENGKEAEVNAMKVPVVVIKKVVKVSGEVSEDE